ncbi:MAG: TlpA family protein disulfide reductase [Pyrinomonadaceae bacterium]|nr:TlpA family protein disulfide reductase [Pyrinomonadaceae bacterium]
MRRSIFGSGAFLCLIFVCALAADTAGQAVGTAKAAAKKVVQIDTAKLETLLKPNGRPLLVNFWATWCDPCREEFPDLVKLDAEYKGKLDVITISLDDLVEIDRDVPKFLGEVKADMPAYLLKTADEDAAIRLVSKDWAGNLPLTVLIDTEGRTTYQRNGKFRYETLKENIARTLGDPPSGFGIIDVVEIVKVVGGNRDEARYYYENNWRVYREAAVKRGIIESFEYVETATKDAAFDIILITRYANEEQYKNSEKAFEPILKELRPKGPLLRGSIQPDSFRQIVHSYVGKTVFRSVK